MQSYSREVAISESARIAKLGPFQLLTDGSELPVFAFTVAEAGFSVFDVSAALRESGWLVPANRQDLAALRVVVRNGFTHDMADLFVAALESCLPQLRKQSSPVRGAESTSFTHGANLKSVD